MYFWESIFRVEYKGKVGTKVTVYGVRSDLPGEKLATYFLQYEEIVDAFYGSIRGE